MRRLFAVLVVCAAFAEPAFAQKMVRAFPKEVIAAKTVAIVNDTHDDEVRQGAEAALKRWGRFTVVDDSDTADITLVFDKKSEHSETSSDKPAADGSPQSGFSVAFSSAVHMKASLKGSDNSFFTTSTEESKKKAGDQCVVDFQRGYLAAR
jgi:hypothetical protein